MSDYFDSDELLKDFYLEAEQQVEILEHNILAIENDKSDSDAIDEIFRAAHTLKGGAATVQMTELAEFTHIVEDLLDAIRANKVTIITATIDALLEALDVIKAMLEERKNGSIYNQDVSDLKTILKGLTAGSTVPSAPPAAAPVAPAQTAAAVPQPADESQIDGSLVANNGPSAELTQDDIEEMQAALPSGATLYRVRVEFDEANPMNSVGGIQVFASLKTISQVLRTFPDFDKLYEDNFFPFVDYYIASSNPLNEIEAKGSISDATLSIAVSNVSQLQIVGSAVPAQPAVAAPPAISEPPAATPPPQPIAAAPAVTNEVNDSGIANLPLNEEEQLARRAPAAGSTKVETTQMLNVDSKRIDVLLNLVSEIVITKGAFNQVLGQLNNNVASFQYVKSTYNMALKKFIDNLPDLITNMNSGEFTIKDVRKSVTNSFQDIFFALLGFEAELRGVEGKIKGVATDLGRTTNELHESVLKVRMVPVDKTFKRFPKLVRDLSRSLNKEVHLEIIGGETEMDKTVAEKLTDPLMHCVRNSMDHGIELPDVRERRGKSREGNLILKASNQGNTVIIEITDDGNGIDVNAIKAKAIERGIIKEDKVLSNQEAFNLMMEPGFSTAKQITNVSGRGVGLDVVKRSIEGLNGEISIWSELGHGTTFTIKLPLTLANI